MNNKNTKHIFPAIVFALFFCVPTMVFGYGEGTYYSENTYYAYNQSTYYAESTYYAQGTYAITFTTNTTISGTLDISGQLTKSGGGSFVIDHPLDPFNKLLFHSFVESPDVKNIYDGVAKFNDEGEATIELPAYFMALNKDFRYQIKPLDISVPNLYIKKEIENNQFTIGGGVSGGTVSWQVTGIRHDPYILAYPIIPEVDKGPDAPIGKSEYIFEGYYDTESYWQKIKRAARNTFKTFEGFFLGASGDDK